MAVSVVFFVGVLVRMWPLSSWKDEALENVYSDKYRRIALLLSNNGDINKDSVIAIRAEEALDELLIEEKHRYAPGHGDESERYYRIIFAHLSEEINKELLPRLDSLESKVDSLSNNAVALNHAINPTDVEYMIAIPRLNDHVNSLNKEVEKIEKKFEKQMELYKELMKSEVDSLKFTMNLILGAIAPLVINFFLSIRRDDKKSETVGKPRLQEMDGNESGPVR
ncbi:MAG: hypothetical protein MI685_12910 [Chlorobiales bacterium]|nr:hypothetical protein [Chlorobiales bacterium]